MRIDGKNYYLNSEESLALAENNIHPDREALQRRSNFFAEIDRTLLDVHVDSDGNVFAQVAGLAESEILAGL